MVLDVDLVAEVVVLVDDPWSVHHGNPLEKTKLSKVPMAFPINDGTSSVRPKRWCPEVDQSPTNFVKASNTKNNNMKTLPDF